MAKKNQPREIRFKLGDTVRLKAGGPVMSVATLPDYSRLPSYSEVTSMPYRCQWFAGKKLEDGYFHEDQLEQAAPAAPVTPSSAEKSEK